MEKLRLAILDMYEGTPNQGMRCIKEIVERFETDLTYKVFDIRGKAELPDTSYDIYISTGGPGSPFDGDGEWDKKYYALIDSLWDLNKSQKEPTKYVFFICHSFQMACIHFKVGNVCKRKSMSFGTFPVHKTEAGRKDIILRDLPSPFWAADFRDYQVIEPDVNRLKELGAEIIALEKIRPHVALERAIMGIRFSRAFFAVQFHPEADPDGMHEHFLDPERRKKIIEEHEEEKYLQMITDLKDPGKIAITHNIVLPKFILMAIHNIRDVKSALGYYSFSM
jgi:homoserine O-succinyltransferase